MDRIKEDPQTGYKIRKVYANDVGQVCIETISGQTSKLNIKNALIRAQAVNAFLAKMPYNDERLRAQQAVEQIIAAVRRAKEILGKQDLSDDIKLLVSGLQDKDEEDRIMRKNKPE